MRGTMNKKTLTAPKNAAAASTYRFCRGQSFLGRKASQTIPNEMTALMIDKGYEIYEVNRE